jgi:predicted Zn-dependent protease
MKTFPVKYFDGKSSKSFDALLTIFSNYWNVSIKENNFSNNIRWEIEHIKSSKVYTHQIKSFSYGNYPFQHIEYQGDDILIEIEKFQEQKKLCNKTDSFLHKFGAKSVAMLMLAIVTFSGLMYFYVIPNVAEKFAENIDSNYVIAFGDYVFNPLKSELNIDDERSAVLQDFTNQLNLESEYPIEVYVANIDQLNAFAMPGGKIVIFSGLLDKFTNASQLAALLGHEVAHIKNRHILKNISRNLSGYLFISILFGDINGISTILIENAHMFKQMSHSRTLEREADKEGLEMLIKNKINPKGMQELFQILKDETKTDIYEKFKYINSHPLLNERIDYIKTKIESLKYVSETNQELEKLFNKLQN